MTGALAGVLFANLLACTEYVPVQAGGMSAVNPAQQVLVTLTDQGRVDVAPRLGLRAVTLEGLLQSTTDSTVAMTVQKVSRDGGIEDTYAGEQISIPRRDVDAIATSRTSVVRSILLAGAIVAGSFLVARGAGDLSGGKTGGGSQGGGR
ncbi:MAG TPA: hypothetical protein VGG76_11220 [Gemmatimonadaceae bacterium]